VIYALIAIVIFSTILHGTPTGAHIYASGDNQLASELMGINTSRLGIAMYTTLGLLSGFVGLMTAARLNAASPMAVDGMTLRVIAAAVIGGVRLNGGRGSIVGGLLGLILMNILGNAMIQLGVSPYWQKGVLGGTLLLAVLIETVRFKRRKRNV
jgi:ribose/xylose/arabinose/galactoside ABC-type transport system permease subunit